MGNLQPEDIMACLQGTAYMPMLEEGDGQEYAWFGSGIPDGGRAILTMDDIAQARMYVEQKDFANAVLVWQRVITNLKDFALPSHISEALEAYSQSQQDLQPFFNGIIDQLPSLYPNHRKDRKQCLALFAQGNFKGYFEYIKKTIYANTDSRYLRNFEMGLITVVNQRERPYFVTASNLMDEVEQWENSFLSSEIEPYLVFIKQWVGEVDEQQGEKRFLRDLASSLDFLSYSRKIKLPKDLQAEVDALLPHEARIKALIDGANCVK